MPSCHSTHRRWFWCGVLCMWQLVCGVVTTSYQTTVIKVIWESSYHTILYWCEGHMRHNLWCKEVKPFEVRIEHIKSHFEFAHILPYFLQRVPLPDRQVTSSHVREESQRIRIEPIKKAKKVPNARKKWILSLLPSTSQAKVVFDQTSWTDFLCLFTLKRLTVVLTHCVCEYVRAYEYLLLNDA
jgi:hypothetical protein